MGVRLAPAISTPRTDGLVELKHRIKFLEIIY